MSLNLLIIFLQESLDQLNKSKTDETQIEKLKVEMSRIKNIEPMLEKLKVKISYHATHCLVLTRVLKKLCVSY